MRRAIICLFVILAAGIRAGAAPQGYYRFPALHGDMLIFTAHGDLYRVSASGGIAQPLTTHPEEEAHACISPDGKLVAFNASYEGPYEAYVMPVDGGLPTRLTFTGDSGVVGWTPDGKVLCRTDQFSTLPNAQLVVVDVHGKERTLIPLAQASDGCYDDHGTLYFTRLPFQGSHTKRYKGGTAQQIWKFAPGAAEATPLTRDYDGTSKQPMWWNGRVYFVTDRDGFMNLWSMDADGHDLKQLTHHVGWDVQSPSLDSGRIAYQLGADIHLCDIATGKDATVDIRLASDLDQTREKWVAKPMEYLTAAHVSGDGEKVALTARGQVFVVPASQGRLVEASRKPGVRYRFAQFLPDGKSLIVLSDESGEAEWWELPPNGIGKPEQITKSSTVLNTDGAISPDGKWLVYGNRDQELWLLDLKDRKTTKIASSLDGEYSGFAWSPDSKWIAYVMPTQSFDRIAIYSLKDARSTVVTSDRSDSENPAWSPDGKWLYFLSNRTFRSAVGSPWGPRQPEPFFDKQTRIYALGLQKGLRSPFQPADELHATPEKSEKNDKEPKGAPAVHVDLDGLADREWDVPVPPGNYSHLAGAGNRLFYVSSDSLAGRQPNLMVVEIANKDVQPKSLVDGVGGFEVSDDRKHLFFRKGDALYVIDATAGAPASLDKKQADLSGWSFPVEPREEWRQMFVEAWRLERDYFYDRKMHGVDWPAMLQHYRPLVDRVTDRAELSDLLAQMVSELSALHTFVGGGDYREGTDHVNPASLGALLSRDEKKGGYRIDYIYHGEPDYPDSVSPLARPDVDAGVGDVITAINGTDVLSVPDPHLLLRNQAGRQVLMHLKTAAGKDRDVIVTPISTGRAWGLRYDDWELSRRKQVDDLGKGQIGYVHLRAMGSGDIAQWARDFYPVFNRQGLIVDVRHNGGGNIDSWILEKLMRKAWFYWQPRVGNPSWNMQWAFRGHLVVLCDEDTASDGEAFTEGFRRLGIGKVIGTRTWGGEVWLSFDNTLVDNGIATAAETGVYGPEGAWLIEGRGVEPDIVVDNLPHATFGGEDAQLKAAVSYLQRQIQEHPVPIPAAPAYPNKSFRPRNP